MTNPAVAVHGLTKIFPVPFHPTRGVLAVKDLSLRIEPGEVYGLLGPNGSGKSTTLKIILGLVSPTRGRTEIFGRDSRLVESREAVGFLPENPYFYKYLTGAETLLFFGRLCGMTGATLKSRVNELLDLVGLNKARDRRLGTYSKGMLQRIGLAQAQEICDRIGILADGVLVREGRLQELIAIENQTELVIADASDELMREIESFISRSNAKLLERRKSTTTLERLFLESTGGNDKSSTRE